VEGLLHLCMKSELLQEILIIYLYFTNLTLETYIIKQIKRKQRERGNT